MLKLIANQLLNVLITLLVVFVILNTSGFALLKKAEYFFFEKDKDKLGALMRSSDHTELIELVVKSNNKEMQQLLIDEVLIDFDERSEEENRKIITEITLKLLEEEFYE